MRLQFPLSSIFIFAAALPIAYLDAFALYFASPILADWALGEGWIPDDAIARFFPPGGFWFPLVVVWAWSVPLVVSSLSVSFLVGLAQLRFTTYVGALLPLAVVLCSARFATLRGWGEQGIFLFSGAVCWLSLLAGSRITKGLEASRRKLLPVYRTAIVGLVVLLAATSRYWLLLTYPELAEP